MKRFAAVCLFALVAGCANAPERPGTYAPAQGSGWIITYVSSALTGSTHLLINGERVASGSFGLLVGQRAAGAGRYQGHEVAFSCAHRYAPVCLVFVDGQQAAELQYRRAAS